MRFILIRHGETDHNVENRMSGWTEAMLSPLGIQQAQALRDRLTQVDIDRLITSGLERAKKQHTLAFPTCINQLKQWKS